jgi:hypothetical protein
MAAGLLLGGLISGALGLGKAIFGGAQAAKGQRQMKNLLANRPTYQIPESYKKMLGIYSNLAQGEMPGQQRYEDLIGQSTARSMTNAERGAISSNVYQGSVLSAQDKELEALKDLALMGTQYKTGAMKDLAGAQQTMGQLQDQAWNYNVATPYDIKLNMANEQRQAGAQNLFGGLGDISSTVTSLVGTKYYADLMKGMYPQNSARMANPNQVFSTPMQSNTNPASNFMSNVKVNYPSQYDWLQSELKKQGYNNL